MTIIDYIIRVAVALIFSISFILCAFSIWDANAWNRKVDLLVYISGGISLIFAYLLWVIK